MSVYFTPALIKQPGASGLPHVAIQLKTRANVVYTV